MDVWLNNPVAPYEASGTSGMKAALNGVPSLSVLDGWWVEGCVEGVTGWAIGTDLGANSGLRVGDPVLDEADGSELYRVLAEVATCYYQHPDNFATAMRLTISLNGSFFTAQRMVSEYAGWAYKSSQPSDQPVAPPGCRMGQWQKRTYTTKPSSGFRPSWSGCSSGSATSKSAS